MAPSPKRRRRVDPVSATEVAIAQAQYMIRIYAEILAMDAKIIDRIQQLIVKAPDNKDREAVLSNLRLMLAQLEKVGQRVAYWNSRVRALVKTQLQ